MKKREGMKGLLHRDFCNPVDTGRGRPNVRFSLPI